MRAMGPDTPCPEMAHFNLMQNHNQCVAFFERRNFDQNNKNTDNNNLRGIKYSICINEQYKNLLKEQDNCNNGNIVYDPKNIDFLQSAYDTIKNAEVEPEEDENGNPLPKREVMRLWNGDVQLSTTYTLEDKALVSKSLEGFATHCQNYSQNASGEECAKGKAYNKCISVMNNVAAFWNKVDSSIAATFPARDLSEICQ